MIYFSMFYFRKQICVVTVINMNIVFVNILQLFIYCNIIKM